MPKAAAKDVSTDALKNSLYSEAMRKVRDNHREEFDALVTELFEANGLTYKKRLTGEEKVRVQIARLAQAAGISVFFDENPEATQDTNES